MDPIIKGFLKDFTESFGLENNEKLESKNFEKFSFFSIIGNEFANLNENDVENISVDDNKGIDGIGIIVNDRLMSNVEELVDYMESNKIYEATIFFIQSKTSPTFEDSEIGNFCDTVKDFLHAKPKYDLTEKSNIYHDILLILYENLVNIKEFRCKLFYCTTGNWTDGTSCASTISIKKKEIEDLRIFHQVEIKPVDNESIRKLYTKVTQPLKTEFVFDNKTELKKISGVQEAYLGVLPFEEFEKIMIDSETKKIKNLFYDNVRDDLGLENEVNEKIDKTLKEKEYSIFPLLNNGITIIAEKNLGRSGRFVLDNYQIVNGCQTSNVIYRNKDLSDINNLFVPIKLIITDNEDIKDKIIISTNSQTEIKEEQLLALTKFQKGLEEFYKQMKDGLYYERRVSQYAADKNIKKKNIVDIREQIKSFVAMFLDEPHVVSGYFGKVYRERKGDIFIKEHKYEPYYISGLTQYLFKHLLNTNKIERKYNKARYHLFLLFRKITEPYDLIDFKKKKITEYCEQILIVLRDEGKCLSSFNQAMEIINKSGIDYENQKEIYKKSTTITLLDTYNKTYK
jgi:hypothetical protein